MLTRLITYTLLLCCSAWAVPVLAQQDIKCNDVGHPITQGQLFVNYGGVSNSYSIRNRSSVSIGQMVVGNMLAQNNTTQLGFWSIYQIPPLKPVVTATQGELLDRIQVSWTVDPLSAAPTEGFKLFRDGVFLALLDNKTNNFNDFNVIAGRPYNYEVRGINQFGQGQPGKAVGFQVPDGVVTGWVQTASGQPVPDAIVALTPLQGFSAVFGSSDGAFAKADAGTNSNLLPPAKGEWTLAFWVKTTSAGANAGFMSLDGSLFLRPMVSTGGHEGIHIAQTAGGPALLTGQFPDSTKNGWHHVALTVDAAGKARLYINGTLAGITDKLTLPASAAELRLGTRTGTAKSWQGGLDELRIYYHLLDELDLGEVMMGTASSQTPHLKYYWKMDEELGSGSFDILRRNKLFFCGAKFDKDRPQVRTMGKTNVAGFYRIESASYSTGTTFLAEPMKSFYLHRALKFVPGEKDYATLPNFPLPPKATLELWVNSADPVGTQCLLAKKWGSNNEFRLLLKEDGFGQAVYGHFNGQEKKFGLLGMGYQHLAFTIDSSGTDRTVTAYKNGVALGSPEVFTKVAGNGSDMTQTWMLGARPTGASTQADYFNGLIDEFALYETTLSAAAILDHFKNARNAQEKGLRVHYALDEGSGNVLHNTGSALLNEGTKYGAEWSSFANQQKATPHVFSPGTRQVTLNPSVTSVDQVDFTDRSTVPVSGFVRYKNTDCFAKNVEILVNGESFSPKIFTDSTGKFTIDFDPGATARLTPKFEDHNFIPAFWEVTNVVNPIAGILFSDVTTRTVRGQVAGGTCKKSIIEKATVCLVKISSADGCLERVFQLDSMKQDGEYEFMNLPPLDRMTIAVTAHSNPVIKDAFQTQGGSKLNLTKKDTAINFIYFAPPQVEIVSGLEAVSKDCPTVVLNQNETVTLEIKVKEQYEVIATVSGVKKDTIDNGVCYLDTAKVQILNGFADKNIDTTLSKGKLKYRFKVGTPNPSPPYLKTMQIIGASLAGRSGNLLRQGVVTGILNKSATFTTVLPQTPFFVLHDPPGDASYAYWEKGQTICNTTTMTAEDISYNGIGVELHLGPDFEIALAPLGVGENTPVETNVDTKVVGFFGTQKTSDNSFQTCITTTERITTSESDQVAGDHGGDVYVGAAMNLIFGFADNVEFDAKTCTPTVKTVLNVDSIGFSTRYMYTEWYVNNHVIRYLDALAADPKTKPEDKKKYEDSKKGWQRILGDNAKRKATAKTRQNYSFDAGTTYEYSMSHDTSNTSTSVNNNLIGNEEDVLLGATFGGLGADAILHFSTSGSSGKTTEEGKESGITTGFILSDDDAGDAFSVDVGMDTLYQTPIFRTKIGQSSCPWEKGTAHREAPNLQLAKGTGFLADNIPAHEPAVFQLQLGNLSATNEDWTYSFSAMPGSNPKGAIIKLNGQPLIGNPVKFFVPYGTSTPITLTVERGPVAYDYDSLQVALFSQCEYDADLSLGVAPDSVYFSRLYLGAHFIRPCSEVDINVPEQNWVIFPDPLTPGPDDEMRITVSGYNENEPLFDRVRVQYRPSDGDGAWINIKDVLKADLGDVFTQVMWNSVGLADGFYEIRALTVCTGTASDKSGFSQIIKGRIDRQAPSLVGKPQPADGVYHVGDEISFTFNQSVNCNKLIKLIQAAGSPIKKNNVGLYDAATGKLIDSKVTCVDNKIVLDPTFKNESYENKILRAELDSIQDLTGNTTGLLTWEFYVDRNELAWLTDSLGITKYNDEPSTATARIHNRGGSPVPFSIKNVPDWVRVVPNKGTLAPNEIRDIRFEVDTALSFGTWTYDSIMLHTETGQNPFFMGGDERLPFGVRVLCRPIAVDLPNPAAYEGSMNLVVALDFDGTFSEDEENIVFGLIDGEVRGHAKLQYVPQVNKWLAYLTVYGDDKEIGAPMEFYIWYASGCESILARDISSYSPNKIVGSVNDPFVIHASDLVFRDIPVQKGWNWISFNLDFDDSRLNTVVQSSNELDLFRGQTSWATAESGSWEGSLTEVDNRSLYQYFNAGEPYVLYNAGRGLDPSQVQIPLQSGWNWISYVPQHAMPINVALGSVGAKPGDIIKGQTTFAEYLNDQDGWVGNLKALARPNGYQLRVSNSSTLVYPKPQKKGNTMAEVTDRGNPEEPVSSFWTVNAAQFEHTMTMVAMLDGGQGNATTANMELGVFANGQVRGAAKAIFVNSKQAYLFFVTMYANTAGENLSFKLYDSSTGQVRNLKEQMVFTPSQHQGSLQNPVPFTMESVATTDGANLAYFEVLPNPFNQLVFIRFSTDVSLAARLSVTDVMGRLVMEQTLDSAAGMNTVQWNTGAIQSGMYFVRLETADGSVVRKVVRE